MWIVLLDHSSSMGEPFSGRQDFKGRSKSTASTTKLAAAIDAVLERLPGRDPAELVVIIGFTERAQVVAEDTAREHTRIRLALHKLHAVDGTDISAALTRAKEYLDSHREPFASVLLVTDGQSEARPAQAAKAQLVNSHMVQLSAILIDPSDAAENLLRTLLHNGGEIQAVVSSGELSAGVQRLDEAQQAFAREVREVHQDLEADVQRTLKARRGQEDLSFSAAYSPRLVPERWTPFLLFLHASSLEQQIMRLLRERASEIYIGTSFASQETHTSVPRGTELTIRRRLPGVDSNPREQRLTWEEDVHDLTFRVRAHREFAGQRIVGSIDLFVNEVPVGDLPVAFSVAEPGEGLQELKTQQTRGRLYRRVFASYSRKDSAVVKAAVATYEALGIYVYLDKNDLRSRSGDAWQVALRRFIDDSEVFQLYWSHHAQESRWVEMEWRHALDRMSAKGERFIRPVVWTDEFPSLPAALQGLQAGTIDLTGWLLAASQTSVPAQPPAPTGEREAVVVPVLPVGRTDIVTDTRSDLSHAVTFLEEATGLRYYPVATLLVDDHVVRSVRRVTTVDDPSAEPDSVSQAEALAELLQGFALAFHVRFHVNRSSLGDVSREAIDSAFGRGSLVDSELFDAIRQDCEWAIRVIVSQFPAIAAARLRDEMSAPAGVPIASLARVALEGVAQSLRPGIRWRGGLPTVWLTPEELTSIEKDLRAAGVGPTPGQTWVTLDYDAWRNLSPIRAVIINDLTPAILGLPTRFMAPDPPSPRLKALGTLLSRALESPECSGSEALYTFVSSATNPAWKNVRATFGTHDGTTFPAADDAVAFLGTFLRLIGQLFSEGAARFPGATVESYPVHADAWHLCRDTLDLTDTVVRHGEPTGWGPPSVTVITELATVARVFVEATERLVKILAAHARRMDARAPAIFNPTFGIFVSGSDAAADEQLRRWALDVGIPPELTLPGTPRVLLCLDALERFRAALRAEGRPTAAASLFQRVVLVHEHFHAAVETGIDPGDGLPAQQNRDWSDSLPVHEALAAWMELHLTRDIPSCRSYVEEYIDFDHYPDWPYEGAKALEAIYQSEGVAAIRTWIRRLRRDPLACRVAFDELVAATRAVH